MTDYTIHYATGNYAIEIESNGVCVAVANTFHAADAVIASLQEAEASALIGGMEMSQCCECGAAATQRVDFADDSPSLFFCERCITGTYYISYDLRTGVRSGPHLPSDRAARWASGDRNYDSEPTFASRFIAPMYDEPLLAQCAAAIRACLGGAPAGGGIIAELRRVEAELTKAGW